jgi:hypothetical protein
MACAEHVGIQLRSSMESHLQSISESARRTVNMTTSALPAAQAPVYAVLQREIHYALRAQHPEWVQPNGESPTCDSYESRLAELLRISPASSGDKKRAKIRNSRSATSDPCSEYRVNSSKQSAPEIAI